MIARVQSYTEVYTDNIQLGNRNANKLIKKIKNENLASNQALKQLGGDYLHNVSITQLYKRVHCLQYDYISATERPNSLCQFAFIMKDFNRLHLKGYVLGDIRKTPTPRHILPLTS